MNWYCFINRIAWWLGWAEAIEGHRFDGKIHDGKRCTRCGFRMRSALNG